MPIEYSLHLQAELGEFYYVVDCPLTEKPIPFERDLSRGRAPFDSGPVIVWCSHCQEVHEFLAPLVSSLQVVKTE